VKEEQPPPPAPSRPGQPRPRRGSQGGLLQNAAQSAVGQDPVDALQKGHAAEGARIPGTPQPYPGTPGRSSGLQQQRPHGGRGGARGTARACAKVAAAAAEGARQQQRSQEQEKGP